MALAQRIVTLAASLAYLLVGIAGAQTLGTPVVLDIEPITNASYWNKPAYAIGDDLVLWYGEPKKMEKGTFQVVMQSYDWSSGAHREILITAPSLTGEVIAGRPSFLFNGSIWAVVQDWDKQSGRVDFYAQAYSMDLVPENAPIKFGTVTLEPKGYYGTPLNIQTLISPDGSKLVFYFDGIQSGDIKLAMCWAMDQDMAPIWDGAYRLPVQSLGATTTPHFFNDASVSVSVNAVELDEDNTKEDREGNVEAKVDKNFHKHRSTSFYVLRGETFFKLDAKMLGVDKLRAGALQNSDAGWSFVAFVVVGSGRESRTEWVHGTLGAEGVTFTSRNPAGAGNDIEVLLDGLGSFFVTYREQNEDDLHVLKVGAGGNTFWAHQAPYIEWPDLKVRQGRLMEIKSFSKNSLDKLRNGEAPKADANVMVMIPVMVSWHDGQRSVLPLFPDDSNYKDSAALIAEDAISKHGVVYKGYRQKEGSLTFQPINW